MTAVLALIASHWRLSLALALAAGAWAQTQRLAHARAEFDQYRATQQADALRQRALAAQTSVEAMTVYVDRIAQIDIPVAAVRTGLAGLCQPSAAPAVLDPTAGAAPDRANPADRQPDPLDQLAAELRATERNKARLIALKAGFEAFQSAAPKPPQELKQ